VAIQTHLTTWNAAKVLASWWEMAGVEPPDLDAGARAAQAASDQARQNDLQAAKPASTRAQALSARKPTDSLADAQNLADASSSLEALAKAIHSFDGCVLKTHARNTLVYDGVQGAPVMVIGEAPDREDDEDGVPLSGENGQMLDKMLASIGLSRTTNCHITCLIPWRPPGDRMPTHEEIAVCLPFLRRQIALAAPQAILMLGGQTASALLGVTDGIVRARARNFTYGKAADSGGIYTQCLFSPAYLRTRPSEKAAAWKDLLRFKAQISARGIALSG
jgi:DNA polymerase